jgi:hypothetical protein
VVAVAAVVLHALVLHARRHHQRVKRIVHLAERSLELRAVACLARRVEVGDRRDEGARAVRPRVFICGTAAQVSVMRLGPFSACHNGRRMSWKRVISGGMPSWPAS